MHSTLLASVLIAGSLVPAAALAGDNRVFVGLDLSGGKAFGSSQTTDGGASWAGGGVVKNVKFGNTVGIGGHAGYRFDPAFSGFVSYQHVGGGVSWNADFPLFGVASAFKGTAISHIFMGNLAYDLALSDTTSLRASAGAGFSLNAFSKIVETDVGTGFFLSDVEDHTKVNAAAQIGAGFEHRITEHLALGLDATVSYTGGFETGATRSGNLGVTPITPYKIDDVWRAGLKASVRFEF